MENSLRLCVLALALGTSAFALAGNETPKAPEGQATPAGKESSHSTGSTMRGDAPGVTEAAERMGTPAWLAAHRERFDHCDANDDGVISKEELDAMDDDSLVLGQFDRDGSSTITRAEWDARGELLDRFARADADHDGSISRGELDRLGDTRMSFADIDSDRDGVVSSAEWDNHGLNTDDE
jgi:hypothetical protein